MKSKLQRVKIIRYADDFKLMCNNCKDAKIIFRLTKEFLNKKLKIEISEEKSKIIDIRKKKLYFLGFKIWARKKGEKFICYSSASEKSKTRMYSQLKNHIKEIQKNSNNKSKSIKLALIYNQMVKGMHNYYCYGTHSIKKFNDIGYHVRKLLKHHFGKGDRQHNDRYKEYYPQAINTKSWKIYDVCLFPIDYIKHKKPMQFSKKVKLSKISHKNDTEILYLSLGNSENMEWKKLRAEIYYKSKGKCYVRKECVKHDEFDLHHIVPKEFGGNDSEENLVILGRDVHKELHIPFLGGFPEFSVNLICPS